MYLNALGHHSSSNVLPVVGTGIGSDDADADSDADVDDSTDEDDNDFVPSLLAV